MSTLKEERIDRLMENVTVAREKGIALPDESFCRTALSGMLRLDGTIYAKPKSFRDAPEASVTHRCFMWHGSGGNLMGVYMVDGDIQCMDGDVTYELVDNLALVLRNGNSPATNAWQRALLG